MRTLSANRRRCCSPTSGNLFGPDQPTRMKDCPGVTFHRRPLPQLGLLYMLVYLPMNMLSGANTPLESMPPWLATVMQASPSTHFVSFAQSILYRGAGLDVVWPEFLAVAGIGGLFFGLAILRFRSVAAQAM